MSSTKFKGWLFLFSSALLAACCFMPITTLTAHMADGSKEKTHFTMMPTLSGFIVLALALFCIVIPLIGLKSKAAITATITALVSGGMAAYNYYSVSKYKDAAGVASEILTGTFGTAGNSVVERTASAGFGLYLIVIAIILVLVTGFIYGIAEDDY